MPCAASNRAQSDASADAEATSRAVRFPVPAQSKGLFDESPRRGLTKRDSTAVMVARSSPSTGMASSCRPIAPRSSRPDRSTPLFRDVVDGVDNLRRQRTRGLVAELRVLLQDLLHE